MARVRIAWILVLLAVVPAAAGFVTFESGQVRPLALSPDGTHLFAVDTPDDRLEIFTVGSGTLTHVDHVDSVTVGLEPVAVAARTDSEVWVVNHLSDSVSIVDVGSSPPRVTRTLEVAMSRATSSSRAAAGPSSRPRAVASTVGYSRTRSRRASAGPTCGCSIRTARC